MKNPQLYLQCIYIALFHEVFQLVWRFNELDSRPCLMREYQNVYPSTQQWIQFSILQIKCRNNVRSFPTAVADYFKSTLQIRKEMKSICIIKNKICYIGGFGTATNEINVCMRRKRHKYCFKRKTELGCPYAMDGRVLPPLQPDCKSSKR
jgi:hypothetical protein